MWGAWLATYGLIFSEMSMIPHTAYMASLAPPLAALSGAGIAMFWRAYRAEGWRGWLLPVAVAAEVGWAVFLWRDYAGFLPWARDLMLAAGAVAVVALVVARLSRRARARLVTVALGAGVAAMLAAPATWAASVLDVAYAGSSFNATAGPAGGIGGGPGGGFALGGAGGGGAGGAPGGSARPPP
jgi:4-amino-4-deoxy-L-arabinose transferase-like glycosyltransferase